MNEIPLSLSDALRERYELTNVIGRGGMSTVYLAKDIRHERDVAIKVMRDDLSSALGTERFLREIRIAAGLTHPNILTLIDSGEADELLYYVMPFIPGESLRQRMKTQGPLGLTSALDITWEVADALAYAHRKDIIHRDIKPENILLSEGHALVADFGIAKAITSASDEHLTRTGFPLGTVGYMSPEQAAGATDLDRTTDIFSLACVCFEALTGTLPGKWLAPTETELGRFIDVLPDIRQRFDELPAHVEAALVRALAMHPSQRYQDAVRFCEALTSPGTAGGYGSGKTQETFNDTETGELEDSDGFSTESRGAEIAPREDFVRREVRSQNTAETYLEPGRFGLPSRIVVERSVRGEIYGNDYVFALEDIRAHIDDPGQASTLGNAFEWRTSGAGIAGARNLQVTIAPRSGSTEILAVETLGAQELVSGGFRVGSAALLGFGSAVAAAGGGTPGAILLPAGLIAVTGLFFLAKTIANKKVDKKAQQLAKLVDKLADRLSESRSRI